MNGSFAFLAQCTASVSNQTDEQKCSQKDGRDRKEDDIHKTCWIVQIVCDALGDRVVAMAELFVVDVRQRATAGQTSELTTMINQREGSCRYRSEEKELYIFISN